MTQEEFLKHVVNAVRRYGRDALTLVNDPKFRTFGFRTPEGTEILIRVDALSELCPGGILPDIVVRKHLRAVQQAIQEGERLRAMH